MQRRNSQVSLVNLRLVLVVQNQLIEVVEGTDERAGRDREDILSFLAGL